MKVPIIHWTLEKNLFLLGFLPNKPNNISRFLICLSLLIICPFQLQSIYKITDNVPLMMDGFKDLSADLLLILKFYILWYNQGYIHSLIEDMVQDCENSKSFQDREIIMKYSKYANKFCIYDTSLHVTTFISYNIVCFLIYMTQPIEARELVVPSMYPFNHRLSPIFEIIYIFHSGLVWLWVCADTLSPTFLVTLAFHAGGQIDILVKDINEISIACNITSDRHLFILIRDVINKHKKLINMVDKIEAVYKYVCLLQFFHSTAVICFTGFVILSSVGTSDTILLMKFCIFITLILWQTFAFAFAGELLMTKSSSIPEEVCNCSWYDLTQKHIKLLIMVIIRTQQPLQLTVGKFTTLSIESFTQIVKTSASYLSVLRTRY